MTNILCMRDKGHSRKACAWIISLLLTVIWCQFSNRNPIIFNIHYPTLPHLPTNRKAQINILHWGYIWRNVRILIGSLKQQTAQITHLFWDGSKSIWRNWPLILKQSWFTKKTVDSNAISYNSNTLVAIRKTAISKSSLNNTSLHIFGSTKKVCIYYKTPLSPDYMI